MTPRLSVIVPAHNEERFIVPCLRSIRAAERRLAAPVELVVKPEDWKLATVAKNEKMWRIERKVSFAKAPPKPAPKAEPVPATPAP